VSVSSDIPRLLALQAEYRRGFSVLEERLRKLENVLHGGVPRRAGAASASALVGSQVGSVAALARELADGVDEWTAQVGQLVAFRESVTGDAVDFDEDMAVLPEELARRLAKAEALPDSPGSQADSDSERGTGGGCEDEDDENSEKEF